MKKIYLLISILLSLLGAHAQQHILLQFSSQNNIPTAVYSDVDSSYTINSDDTALTSLFGTYKITAFKKEYPHAHLVNHPNAEPLDRVYRIEASDSISSLYEKLQTLNSSMIDGPMYLLDPPQALVLPDDYDLVIFNAVCVPRSSKLQNDLINAPAAWDITTGNPNLRIGIFDENFRRTQEELTGKIVDDYAAPYVQIGSNSFSHGTAVAGVAAGNTNNGVGIASVGYNCKMDLYNLGDYDGMIDAAIRGVKVINCSFLSACFTPVIFEQNTINMLHDVYNVVVVAAAGNGTGSCGLEAVHYPASYDHVISVSSVGHITPLDQIPNCFTTGYSWIDVHQKYLNTMTGTFTHNNYVDLCAPAHVVAMPRGYADNGYLGGNGTSFASPMVAGTAALILSVNPLLLPDDVEAILKCTARDIYELPQNISYYDNVSQQTINYLNKLGSGRLDAGKAVQLAQTWIPGTGGIQQTAPSDIRWFEILTDGTNTIEVEAATCSSNTPGYCNIGFRLEVVSGNPNLSFKWLNFYSQSGVNVTNSIKYGNSIFLTRGIDYPMTDVTGGSLKICVRVNECIPSLYYSEDRASSCFGPACTYPCPSDIYITGNYSTPLAESYTWIKSVGQTTISASTSIKLDASPTLGFIEMKPVYSSDYFLSAPNSTGVFIAQAFNGCTSGSPSFTNGIFNNNAENSIENKAETKPPNNIGFSVYPNPTAGIVIIRHPSTVKELEVLDMFGNLVLKVKNAGFSETKINLSGKSSGIYMIRIDKVTYLAKVFKR